MRPGRLLLDLPAGAAFATLLAGSSIASAAPFSLAPLDAFLLLAVIASLTACLSIAVLWIATLFPHRPRAAVGFWSVAFLGAGVLVCDAISLHWLSLHLNDTLRMLYWYVKANPVGIEAKLLGLAAGGLLIVAASVAAALVAVTAARRRPWLRPSATRTFMVRALAVSCLAWGCAELVAARALSPVAADARRFNLSIPSPLPSAMGAEADALFVLDRPEFVQLPAAQEQTAKLDAITPASADRPLNVFFIVIESLRADIARSADVMPALAARAGTALTADVQVAAGNCTHVSWTSMLHGLDPLYWTVKLHQAQHRGSVPLEALERAGYGVHAYSSYELNYFNSDLALFGDGYRLADTREGQAALTSARTAENVADLDARVLDRLMARARAGRDAGPGIYFAFLGALHHDYEWPSTFTPRFEPFLPAADLLRGMRGADAPLLFNRYRNAARYTDGLLEKFFAFLDSEGLRDNSIVVVTGDHGEEFMEEGRLVHSSSLNRYQLESPILVFLPPSAGAAPARVPVASHADVFPTILRAIGLDDDVAGLMTGSPLQEVGREHYVMSAQCSTHTPARLLVQTPATRLLLELRGVQKRGHAVFANQVRGVALLDADYRPMAWRASELDTPVLERPDVRAALSRFMRW